MQSCSGAPLYEPNILMEMCRLLLFLAPALLYQQASALQAEPSNNDVPGLVPLFVLAWLGITASFAYSRKNYGSAMAATSTFRTYVSGTALILVVILPAVLVGNSLLGLIIGPMLIYATSKAVDHYVPYRGW